MAQCFKAFVALSGPGLIPVTHIVAHRPPTLIHIKVNLKRHRAYK